VSPAVPGKPPSASGDGRSRWAPRWPTVLALLAGALATVLIVWPLHVHPRRTILGLGFLVIVALVLVAGRRLLRLPMRRALRFLALLVVLAALLGPAVALPQARQVFAFRVLVAVLIFGTLTWALLARPRLRVAPLSLIVWLAAWLGWLLLSLLWAPDKTAGFRYLALLALMVVVLAATTYWGTTRQRLHALLVVLGVALALNLLVATAEGTLGLHLPSSAYGGQRITRFATGFFFNPNDLATYLAMSLPFLLVGLFLTRRASLRALALLGLALSAYALLHTGSRVALVAIGFETLLVIAVLFARGRVRHRGTIAVIGVALLAGLAFLAFNSSQSSLLDQFQLSAVTQQVESGSGSGGSRVALLRAGWRAALQYDLAGAGPGNAEGLVRQQPNRLGELANLHNWWMEVLVDGGLPGLVFYLLFYVGLFVALWGIGRDSADPQLRFLGTATSIAVAGYVIGCWGPSSVFDFPPMWVLFGLGLAVVLRAERLEEGQSGHRALPDLRGEAAA
jgi:teichuronic acid biosynthesis protein TuaE